MSFTSTEHFEQVALFVWAGLHARTCPELDLMFAIPNGGKRDGRTGAMLQAEGVKAGVPDIFLPVARYSPTEREVFNGLFIEMKWGDNTPTKHQLEWHKLLRQRGYRVEVCYGWQAAVEVISDYLGIEAD